MTSTWSTSSRRPPTSRRCCSGGGRQAGRTNARPHQALGTHRPRRRAPVRRRRPTDASASARPTTATSSTSTPRAAATAAGARCSAAATARRCARTAPAPPHPDAARVTADPHPEAARILTSGSRSRQNGGVDAHDRPEQRPRRVLRRLDDGRRRARCCALVTSANVACGFHAGDASTMLATCRIAAGNGVAVGAHVSYRDLAGFGRRAMDVPRPNCATRCSTSCRRSPGWPGSPAPRVRYVKPHGALYNRIVARSHDQAAAVVEAVAAFDPALAAPRPGRLGHRAGGRGCGPPLRARGVRRPRLPADGTLVPRGEPGALLSGDEAIAARAVRLVREGRVTAADGTEIDRAGRLAVRARRHPGRGRAWRGRFAPPSTQAGIAVRAVRVTPAHPAATGSGACSSNWTASTRCSRSTARSTGRGRGGVVDIVPAARTIAVTVDPRPPVAERRTRLAGTTPSRTRRPPPKRRRSTSRSGTTATIWPRSRPLRDAGGRGRRTPHGFGLARRVRRLRARLRVPRHRPRPARVPRRATPRTAVPAGAVGLAGAFSGVYPRSSPGGWQLIGSTDAVLWDPDRRTPGAARARVPSCGSRRRRDASAS